MIGSKVLVLGDDTRSFLAIVRSLGRQHITVHAAPSNYRSPALRSRYIAAIHELPPYIGGGSAWLTKMVALLRANSYDLVIPCNEATLLPVQRHRAVLSQFGRLAIPDDGAIAVLFDKYETRRLAQEVAVPVAAGRVARPEDTAEQLLREFGAPIVVKPRHSNSLQRLFLRNEVQITGERTQLERLLQQAISGEILIEQFFSGKGVGVSVLANGGRLLQAFEHHRVHEIAGASFYRRSAPLTPDLIRACETVIGAIRYTGLAMFEFKQNANGSWILLEINARPWGSMPLPVALGVDFPHRWYRLLVAGEETGAVSYRTGIYGRNLLPDLHASIMEAATRRLGIAARTWFITKRVAGLSRVLSGSEVHDVLVRDDPRPGLIELMEIVKTLGQRARKRLPGSTERRYRRARAQVKALRRKTDRPCVVFVCQGNICRSPFAEALLRVRIEDTSIAVRSAGILPTCGRPTPILGLQAAAMQGIDLSTHRSTWLTRQMAETSSLLIVFDGFTQRAMLDRYPDLNVPIISLGDLTKEGPLSDPVDGGPAEFRFIYEKIAAAVAELALLLQVTPTSGGPVF